MKSLFVTTLLLAGGLCAAPDATAQIINPGEIIKRKAEQRTNDKIDRSIDEGLDQISEGLGNIFGGKKDKAQPTNNRGNSGNSSAGSRQTSSSGGRQSGSSSGGDVPDFGSYKGSTFIPGKEVLFFENFASARLGGGTGNWNVVYWDKDPAAAAQLTTLSGSGDRWLKIPKYGIFYPNSFKTLPEACTIEFDLYADVEEVSEMQSGLRFSFTKKEDRPNFDLHFDTDPQVMIDVHPSGKEGHLNVSGRRQYGLEEEQMRLYEKDFEAAWNPGVVNHVAISRMGRGVKLFINGREYVDLPGAFLTGGTYNFMMSSNQFGNGIYVTNIRVGGKVPNATQEIKASGKFVTNAIYFDVNTARMKPESWATLQNAATAIKGTSGNILVVGHTDSDGSDDANLKLSQNRAATVKTALVNEFGIPASRLLTDGKGESQPVGSNNTPSGKAENRRVEFIRQ